MKRFLLLLTFALFITFNQTISQDSWEKTKGPYGGTIYFIGDGLSGSLLAGTDDGLYKSTDGGDNWVLLGLEGAGIIDIAIDTAGNIFACGPNGVLKSDDGGDTWVLASQGFFSDGKYIGINSESVIFAMGRGGHSNHALNVSDNGGMGWVRMENAFQLMLSFVIMDNDEIFAGTWKDGVYKTTNNGMTWTKAGLDTMTVRSIEKDDDGNIYAGTMDNGMYFSEDNGATWESIGLEDYHVQSIYIESDGTIWAGTYYRGLYKSTNGGDSWSQFNSGLDYTTVLNIFESTTGDFYLGMMSGGVYRSGDNGLNWSASSYGIDNIEINSIIVNGYDEVFAGASGSGVYKTTNNGNNWVTVNSGLQTDILVLAINSNGDIFAGTSTNGIFRSTNRGGNWTQVKTDGSYHQVRAIEIDDDDDIYASLNGEGIYHSTDNGMTWTNIGLSNVQAINDLAVDGNGVIYAGTYMNGLYKSTNNGTTWDSLSFPAATVRDIFINKNGKLLVSDHLGYLRTSTNSGQTWASAGYFSYEINDMVENSLGTLYMGARVRGVYKSTDEGDNWEQVITGMGETSVNSLFFTNAEDLFAGTSDGVYTSIIDENRLEVPRLESPRNNSFDIGSDTTFSWYIAIGAASYDLLISTDENFSTTFTYIDGITGTEQYASGFENYTTYYWKVRSVKPDSVSPWSESWHFTTKIAPPVLISPANFSNCEPQKVKFEWQAVAGATGYFLQVSKDPDFLQSENVFSGPIQDGNSHTLGLQFDTEYYWHVMVKTDDSESDWSAKWTFRTGMVPPILESPVNDSTGLDIDVTLTWLEYHNADFFELEVAEDEEFSEIIYTDTNIAFTEVDLYSLERNKKYYWHLRVKSGQKKSLWSETWNFRTGMAVPVLLTPPDNSTDIPLDIKLTWEEYSGASRYTLQLAKDADFSMILLESEQIGTDYDLSGLDYETEYFWRVKALVDQDYTPWSDVWSFTTIKEVIEELAAPVLLYPPDDTTDMETSIVFMWDGPDEANHYQFQISENADFSSTLHDRQVYSSESHTYDGLDYNTKYYWRAKSYSSTEESEWSQVFSFTTMADVGVDDMETITGWLTIDVYPNPFTETVSFRYSLLQQSNISLKVYNSQGDEIVNLLDINQKSGEYTVNWNPSSLANGVYYYLFNIDGKKLQGNLIHVK